jgi:rare lipoprotein A
MTRTRWRRALYAFGMVVAIAGCSHAPKPAEGPGKAPAGPETGIASYYAAKFEGRMTASGERYRGSALTAAHRTLPFGSRVRVTNLTNGRSVVVVINDRGPHKTGRIIDLSHEAAETIDLVDAGLAKVRVERVAASSD